VARLNLDDPLKLRTLVLRRAGHDPQVLSHLDLTATAGVAASDEELTFPGTPSRQRQTTNRGGQIKHDHGLDRGGDGEEAQTQLYSGHVFGDHISLLNGAPWNANKRKTSNNALAATALARVRDSAVNASVIISALGSCRGASSRPTPNAPTTAHSRTSPV
jgi:hypothetical protein